MLAALTTVLLLASVALVAAEDKNQGLTKAVDVGDVKGVAVCLDDGADANAKDGSDRTVLMRASGRGYFEVTRLLLDRGADVNAKDKKGNTALLSASGRGGHDVVKLLLDKGADVKAKNDNGQTALMLPAWAGQADVVELLLDRGLTSTQGIRTAERL